MPEARRHHISSAVVAVRPGYVEGVLDVLAGLANVEVHGCDKGKIVVVIEGRRPACSGYADAHLRPRRRDRGEHGFRTCRIGRGRGAWAAN